MTYSAPEVDLKSMTKAQLLAFAQENGITGVDNSMLKADILKTIEEALYA